LIKAKSPLSYETLDLETCSSLGHIFLIAVVFIFVVTINDAIDDDGVTEVVVAGHDDTDEDEFGNKGGHCDGAAVAKTTMLMFSFLADKVEALIYTQLSFKLRFLVASQVFLLNIALKKFLFP